MCFELGVDFQGDALPGASTDHWVDLQLIGWCCRNALRVLAERIHHERLRERAVSRERHDLRETFEVGHGDWNQVETRKRREPGFEMAYCASNSG